MNIHIKTMKIKNINQTLKLKKLMSETTKFLNVLKTFNRNETLEIIKQHFDKSSVILDPHTAVGVGAANKLKFSDCVVLSTAHPCKFPAATDKAINKHEELPKELQYVHSKEENFQLLKNDTEAVKNFVKSKL